jgi:hypothetical protein
LIEVLVTIKQFNAEKITTNLTMPRTKILITSIVATILITGMIFMSSPQVFANPQESEVTIEFDNSTPNAGDIVAITGTVTTLFTEHKGQGDDHEVIDPDIIDYGLGKIQQGFDGDNPLSSCEDVDNDSWENLYDNGVENSMWTYPFDTEGLGGQTLVFRAHYTSQGNNIATGMSECTELEIGGDPFDGFKTWTHTDYNWDRICTETILVEDPPDTFTEVCIADRAANINNNGQEDPQDPPNLLPDDDVLADSLDPPTEDGISDVLVQVKNTGEILNMNPGAIYALTTVHVLTDLDMLQVDENYGECTDVELELLNQNNLSRNVKVAVADPQ